MEVFLLVLILVGAALALLAGLGALGAYLRLRQTRLALGGHISEEVSRLARRADELQASLSALEARAAQLPVKISELQRSLGTLRVLSGAPFVSLRQAQTVLSYGAPGAPGSTRAETPRTSEKDPG